MIKACLILSFIMAFGLCICMPSLANDPANQAATKTNPSVPLAVFSSASGLIVGTPIAAVRLSAKEMKSIYHEYDNDPLCWKFWGRPLAIPFGIVEGTIKGCIAGPKPFSKEAFSLEALD